MKIVIPDDYQDAVRHLDSFSKLADEQVVIYNDTVQDLDTLVERFQDADALVLIRERTKITEELLARLPKLRVIGQTGMGVAHIDVEACTRHGVVITAGHGSFGSTAELTWGLILAATRHIPQEVARMKAGYWQGSLGVGLSGRTLGVYGYGNIGTAVAGYGRAFGMNVIIWGREGSLERARADGFAAASSRQAFFEESDILSLHIKMGEATRGIITAADLAQMKPSALLVNTSRARLIAPGALLEALRAGRPGSAALDVYEEEPVIDHPFLHMDNVLCTPHLGYVEQRNYELYFGDVFDLLLAFKAGKPTSVLNPQALRSM